MLSPKTGSPKDESTAEIKQVEGDVNTANEGSPPIDLNIRRNGHCTVPSYFTDVQVSPSHISLGFRDLLTLFEDYAMLMKTKHDPANVPFQMKRVQSETVVNEDSKNGKPSKSSSLTDLSDCTLRDRRIQAPTCDVSSQTYWSAVDQKQFDMKDLETQLADIGRNSHIEHGAEKPSKTLQHTIHIEVESVTSATDMQRAPLRQRMWNVLTQTLDSIVACTYMIGENFSYVLFVLLCLWCLYLLMGHYYSSLPTNVNQQMGFKKDLARIHPK
ncbi:uncharacterized protein LOC110185126 [Drosophila serrata]|uniref:uncharacterized protein LOC110185126 n=1 Tax=Drosophila serrata TaxID=7274 RepID=UPI000A1CFBD6|nr:uncharacterized protein LOC110185126 [Drosophila serrata]